MGPVVMNYQMGLPPAGSDVGGAGQSRRSGGVSAFKNRQNPPAVRIFRRPEQKSCRPSVRRPRSLGGGRGRISAKPRCAMEESEKLPAAEAL